MDKQAGLSGKILITGTLTLKTGMHIGGNDDFSPIGGVDSPFIRDVMTNEPIIPGSSLKGKIRTLLAKFFSNNYILNDIEKDSDVLKRLFGSAAPEVVFARLQFFDLFVDKKSKDVFDRLETDTYMGEIKAENTINRITGEAMPRQIERVPAGMAFNFKLVYNVETGDVKEIEKDLETLRDGLTLLQQDYLGGSGSRGYGRVALEKFTVAEFGNIVIKKDRVSEILKGADYGVLHI